MKSHFFRTASLLGWTSLTYALIYPSPISLVVVGPCDRFPCRVNIILSLWKYTILLIHFVASAVGDPVS